MHEMSLMESIMSVVEQEAGRNGFDRVLKLRLEIGDLSSVDAEALRFAFAAIKDGSIARGAELVIERLPGQASCLGCGQVVALKQRYDPCPLCGGERLLVIGGEEMRIKDLEVE